MLVAVINPIITLWMGEDMCFSMGETAVIIACFYMSYIRDPVQIFLKGYGVFKSTKYISLIRGLMNLVLSYVFVKSFGVAGVFAGTLISTVTVPFFAEPYMLFKYGFNLPCGSFVRKYTGFVICSAVICTVCYHITKGIPCETLLNVAFRGIVTVVLANIMLLVPFARSNEMQELRARACRKLSSGIRRKGRKV